MRFDFNRRQIPWLMAAARAALGPVIALGQAARWDGTALASMVVAALLSDIFDGVLARRWKCDTAAVRLFDSMADTVFYLGVAFALWTGHPQLFRAHLALFATLFSLEAMRFAVDFVRFGKPASYHSYLAKSWGLVMAITVVAAFTTRHADWLVVATLTLGVLCDLEGLAMSTVLPAWQKDIKTLRAAWRIRKNLQNTQAAPMSLLSRPTRSQPV